MADRTVVAGSDVSASQLKDFFRQINDGSIRGHHVQAMLEHRNPFDGDQRLRYLGEVMFPVRRKFYDPSSLANRADVYLGGGFHECILTAARPVVKAIPAPRLLGFEIVRPAEDEEILRELPEGYVFEDAGAFCFYLEVLFDRQSGGREGDLLTNGRANIFYVMGVGGEIFAVGASWGGDFREGFVDAHRLGNIRWGTGYRVFSNDT